MNDKTQQLVEKGQPTELIQPASVTPMDMIQMAIQKGTDIDQMEKLMNLQERWEANEAKKQYVNAMAKFRKICPKIGKTKEAHNSMYAGLAETIDQIKEQMSESGLAHSWQTSQTDNVITVTCSITHIGGHSSQTSLSGEPDTSGSKNKIQAVGSTVAYLERYTLFAALGLASGDMDSSGDSPTEYISKEQSEALRTLAEEVGADLQKFCAYMNVTAIPYIHLEDHQKAVTALEAKKAK